MKRTWILLAILLTVLICAGGCNLPNSGPAETPQPSAEPEPSITPPPFVVELPSPEPTEFAAPLPTLPVPTPSPVPQPTAIPFSHYAPTVGMSFEELIGSLDDIVEKDDKGVLWPKGYPPADTYKIIVDLYWQVVMVYSQDDKGEFTVPVRYMLCSTGSARVGAETRTGVFKMLKVRARFGEFMNGYAAQYWSLIYSRTYFHSILYTRRDLSTYDVKEYNKLGTKASHACIRLPVPDARWIWYNISYDTVCEIRKGSKNDAQTEWIRSQLILAIPPVDRISNLAGTAPWTDNWRIEDVDTTVPFINEAQPKPPSS
ncbi:MAG: L,D-transpeptidase family protein [Clostridiales bacterium]|nr:L,D-transpeptidase family protein [Clostridiales bacterium]